MSECFRGVNSIWSRLFDHRAFLNGEIQLLLKEFELKRNDEEVENLFEIVENITEIRDTQVDRLKVLVDSLFPRSQFALDEADETCRKIEQLEEIRSNYVDDRLIKNREKRKQEWDQFIDKISDDYDKLNVQYDQEEVKLQEFYRNLDQKLRSKSIHIYH